MQELNVLCLYWGFSLGGVGQYAAILHRLNDTDGIRIAPVCILSKGWQTDTKTLGLLSPEMIIIKSRVDLSWVWELDRIIAKIKPNLIMTNGFNGHFVELVRQSVYGRRIPLICSYHGKYHATTPARRFLEPMFNLLTEYYIRNRVISAVAVAEHSRSYLLSKGIAPEKVVVIHNGIPERPPALESRPELRQQWGVASHEILIGVASRLDPVKGLDYLLDSMQLLVKGHSNIRLAVVGTGTLDGKLKNRVTVSGLEKVVFFTGFRTDIHACLAAFDIFVLPSLAEYHSIGLLEAMRAGKAIVATSVGGNTESVRHGKEGLIVPPGNSKLLGEAMERIIKDNSLRKNLGIAARERFKACFTVEVMLSKTADWLLGIAAGLGQQRRSCQ